MSPEERVVDVGPIRRREQRDRGFRWVNPILGGGEITPQRTWCPGDGKRLQPLAPSLVDLPRA